VPDPAGAVVIHLADEHHARLLIVIDAEDRFDTAPQLHRISAPTLVIAGRRDRCYTPSCSGRPPSVSRARGCGCTPGNGHSGIATLTYKPAVREILGFLTDQPTPPRITELKGAGNSEEPVGKPEADEVWRAD
jgi:hypothetical protein